MFVINCNNDYFLYLMLFCFKFSCYNLLCAFAFYGELDGCIVWNAHNTVFGSKRSAICALAVYFVHSTPPKIQGHGTEVVKRVSV